ncbi:MAG: glycosyltransferase family 4 protein [Fimbriimonadaceae bacterium]|nr:glycosyltransferase family 4 protein [Alphaproteobacteria bacterium]
MTLKIHVISQHFPPDTTSTAKYLTAVAEELTGLADVVAVTGTPDPDGAGAAQMKQGVSFVHLKNHQPEKGKLIQRAIAMSMFALRVLFYCLFRVSRDDIIVAVTTPYTVTFAVGLAARLTGRRAILMLYDLYPDVLVQADLIAKGSMPDRLLGWLNRRLLKGFKAIIVIGRDMERRVGAYVDLTRTKLHYIPMWSDVDPSQIPPLSDPVVRRYRPANDKAINVALSGNLGFTHDPETVFEAARLMADDSRIHFTLSGWGVGWGRLRALQDKHKLPNVTMFEAVPEADLGAFLSSGDLWIIPYKAGMAGVSVPSRFYNLIALGKPIITLAESHADHSAIIAESDIGWVVPPGAAQEFADALTGIADSPEVLTLKGERARSEIAPRYTIETCGESYREAVREVQERR